MKDSNLTLANDSVQLKNYPQLAGIKPLIQNQWRSLRPGKNAANKLLRGIRWGVLVNGKVVWTIRNTYQLPGSANIEEQGRVREFTLIDDEFVENDVIQSVILDKFNTWDFAEKSDWRAYEVQLSLIGYVTTLRESALPSPVYVHRDLIDGSVTVLDIQGDIEGGVTRVFDLDENLIVEASLDVGQSIFMVDEPTRHVVTPISVPLGSTGGFGKRLLMIVRFQPLGR